MLNEIFYQGLTKTVEEIDQQINQKHRESLIKLQKYSFSKAVKCIKQNPFNNENNDKMKECAKGYYDFNQPIVNSISNRKTQFNECILKKHNEENLNQCLKELKSKILQDVDQHINKSLKQIK